MLSWFVCLAFAILVSVAWEVLQDVGWLSTILAVTPNEV